MTGIRDEFLSEEDMDLRNMSESELHAYWDMWLRQAQSTNDLDENLYSHGVFTVAPTCSRLVLKVAEQHTQYQAADIISPRPSPSGTSAGSSQS